MMIWLWKKHLNLVSLGHEPILNGPSKSPVNVNIIVSIVGEVTISEFDKLVATTTDATFKIDDSKYFGNCVTK